MTYNVLYSNLDYDAVAKNILTYDPDLVALQEVIPEMMSALKDRLTDEYPYSLHGTNDDYGVTAVISRYPFSETQVINLGEDRRVVIIKAQVGDQTITFAAVHLRAYGLQWVRPLANIPQEIVNRTNQQNHQVEVLFEELLNEPGPVIIGCDCNSKETSSSYRMLDQQFDSAAYQVGWQFRGIELVGAKQDTNIQHIDFIWYRGALEPFAAYEINDSGGSDHHPVLALFDLR
jgi:endonuclease/exonuclease/phosphatase (EEP) superfamily protein YafD